MNVAELIASLDAPVRATGDDIADAAAFVGRRAEVLAIVATMDLHALTADERGALRAALARSEDIAERCLEPLRRARAEIRSALDGLCASARAASSYVRRSESQPPPPLEVEPFVSRVV